MPLIKLRDNKEASGLSKVPQASILRRILEYYEPRMTKGNTPLFTYNSKYPINYTWPEEVSYHNPMKAVSCDDCYGIGFCFCFKLQSGEQTGNPLPGDGFKDLDW